MATAFFKNDYLSERDKPWQTRQFPTVAEAREWVSERRSKSRWFSCDHISPSDVDAIPLYLVLKSGTGKYMSVLSVTDERNLRDRTVVARVKPEWEWATDGREIAGYSVNGSLFSTSATAPTYINVFVPGFETLAYVLLGGCERPIEGADMALAQELISKRPRFQWHESPYEKDLQDLKYGRHKLITKAMKARITELETLQDAFKQERNEGYLQFQEVEMKAWYDEVLARCL